jgi:hypothetical protein
LLTHWTTAAADANGVKSAQGKQSGPLADIGSQEQVKTLLDSHFLQEIANLGIFDIQIFNDNRIRNRERSKCLGECC